MNKRTPQFMPWPPCRLIFVFALLVTLLSLTAAGAAEAQPAQDETPKKVLIVSSEDLTLPGPARVSQALRSTFRNNSSDRFQFYQEAMDAYRFPEEKYAEELVRFLKRKYEGEKIDLIIAYGPPALRIVANNRDKLLPGTPIIFYYLAGDEETARHLDPDVTGVRSRSDYRKTLETALALQPETENIFVVAGSAGLDKFILSEARQEFARYEGKQEITYLTDLTMEEFRQKVAALPPKSIVILLSLFLDSAGKSFPGPEQASSLASVSSAPVYGTAQTHFGNGIVGGSLMDFDADGASLGQLALRVLNGERPQDIPLQHAPNALMFDGRALRRWGISERHLPPGSTVEFREPTFWQLYRWYVSFFIVVALLEGVLIAALLLQRARRRQAEKESRRLAQVAEEERQRLENVLANVPGLVWETRFEPDSTTSRIDFVNSYAEKALGYNIEEWLSTPNFIQSIIHEADREIFMRQRKAFLAGSKERLFQFRWRAKDGRLLWAEAHVTPILNGAGKVVGMRGVTIDISIRERALEALHQSEQRNLAILRALPDLVFLQSADGTYLDYHARYADDLLAPPAEFLGKSMWDVLPTELSEVMAACFQRAAETGELQVVEYTLPIQGEMLWFEARITQTEGNQFLSVVRNITAGKRAEAALRESQAQLAGIIGSAMDAIITIDEAQRIVLFNAAAEQMFGCSAQEVTGQSIIQFVPERFRESHAERVRDFGKSGIVSLFMGTRGNIFGRRVNGEEFPIEASVSQTELKGEKFYTVILRDITNRQRAEQALKQSEVNYREIFHGVDAAIFIHDTETAEIIAVNQRMCEMFGVTEEEAIQYSAEVLSAGEPPYTEEAAKELIRKAGAGEPQHFEWPARHKSGREFWVEASLKHIVLEGKDRVLSVLHDITDRKRAEAALQEAFAQVSELKAQLEAENIYLKEEILLEHNFDEIIGNSEAIRAILFKVEQVAATDTSVLISGETGTGKELVARALHNTSLRKNRPLVKVNCATLPATLIESELFGHEKGAFTSATARQLGRFELANGSTIFLDEIGDLPLELQAKLLRVLQEGEFERLGSGKTIKVDVRIIAATNRDLEMEVKAGRFREDLFYRLNVFPITIPPLRERKEDIPLLVQTFVRQFSKKLGKTITSITPATFRTLQDYPWPGNVRELANVIERAMVNTKDTTLRLAHDLSRPQVVELSSSRQTLEEMERQYILSILKQTDWRIEGPKGAARVLGLNPSTLRTRMAKLGIQKGMNGKP
ncbi:MAG TPA: sigma 54-interacting transcriptional regulator [Blastocatellia bacterium]|nr:sigma 54-interacting transcriptional regulator [Blastocatellia bacterium]